MRGKGLEEDRRDLLGAGDILFFDTGGGYTSGFTS